VRFATGPALRFIFTGINLFRGQLPPLAGVMHFVPQLMRDFARRLPPVRLGASAAATILLLFTTGSSRSVATASAVGTAPRHRGVGRIEGMVEISASLSARRPPFRIYADPGTGLLPPPAPRDPIAAELRNVVLYLEGDSMRLRPPVAPEGRLHGSMAQRDERFVPHVLPVMQGATVDFPNEDDVYHNVFSLSSAAGPNGHGFDLGRYPKGASRSVTFSKPGVIQVFCHIHSDMSAVILVLANAFFASPGDDHRFAIDDVPEGDYTIVGWHERIKPITRRIHVAAGQTTSVDFNIPLPQGGGPR
jgi:plastocyanin